VTDATRSDRWPKLGLSAHTRERTGALLERWRAQCSLTESTIHDLAQGGDVPVAVEIWERRLLTGRAMRPVT